MTKRLSDIGCSSHFQSWKAAVYIRLSKDDGMDESYSVKNQRQRLSAFLENFAEHENFSVADFYVDDGFTGTDSERAAFQRLLKDIEQNKINCVVVKDLSRLSRNDWECKWYLQHLFVEKNVRFISLELPALDSFKNPDGVYELGVSIQSLYNENHCRETSVKVRGTFNIKRQKGEFIGAFAPFGYKKDPADKHRFVADNEAAAIVKTIFRMFVYEGKSKNAIVKRLTALQVPCPTAYKKQKGINYRNPSAAARLPLWSMRGVTAVLSNKTYLGHMVQGKQKVKSYKVHTRVNLPESQWFVVLNTHEPIIDFKTFEKAQKLLKLNVRTSPKTGRPHIFAGLLNCADCLGTMGRRASKGIIYYTCKTNNSNGLCSRHSIRHDKLSDAVFNSLQAKLSSDPNFLQFAEKFFNAETNGSSCTNTEKAISSCLHEIEKTRKTRLALYPDWKNGEISHEDFTRLKKQFEEKEKELLQTLALLEEEPKTMQERKELNFFSNGKMFTESDRALLSALVKNIFVHEGGKITVVFTENFVS